jgi:hypothetical protein
MRFVSATIHLTLKPAWFAEREQKADSASRAGFATLTYFSLVPKKRTPSAAKLSALRDLTPPVIGPMTRHCFIVAIFETNGSKIYAFRDAT